MPVPNALLEEVAYELHRRAATVLPVDVQQALGQAADRESNHLAQCVLQALVANAGAAAADGRPMCGDTGLLRFYVKAGNDVQLEGGFAALEGALRRATARATQGLGLRANRVHPLTRQNPGTNVGVFAPNVVYAFEPDGDWIELTAVHKGGLFGSDYRMLFPGDGIPGIKRFFLDTIAAFNRRGLSCPPLIVGVGIGGTKDQCFALSKEAACLRPVGDRHPDPLVAQLEEELLALGNRTMLGVMGLRSETPVLDVHCELAYAHTGGLPVAVSQLCHAARRATARIAGDGRVEYRDDPRWFTAYARRDGVGWETAARKAEGGRQKAVAGVGAGSLSPSFQPPAPSPQPLTSGVREFHLTMPLAEADVRQLRVGDLVYLTGCLFTARDGVYEYMLGQGHAPPIDLRRECNVTMQASPAGVELTPGRYEVASLQATAGFRYARWMEPLCARYGVRAVIGKGGMAPEVYRRVFRTHGAVCLSTMGYGLGAVYGRAVQRVRAVHWREELGISEAMWLLEVENLGPLLVEGDTEGNSFFAAHAAEVDGPLLAAYAGLPAPILRRLGDEADPTRELIGGDGG